MKNEILDKWLKVDLYKTASKIGLIDKNITVSDDLIMSTIRCLDYESCMVSNPSVNYIITVIGLMWENIDHESYDIRRMIIKVLSRIGYIPAAIICDDRYDYERGCFYKLDSIIDEVISAVYQMKTEITIAGRIFLLTDFQKQIWDSMDKNKLLGISAPTSAGKSYVILLKLCERLLQENVDVVYIVPTLSLLVQVTEDFKRELNNIGVKNYRISNVFSDGQIERQKNIYVMTQEKAISAFSDFENAFSHRLILVADEIQNIERISEDTDERAKILYDALVEFRYKKNVDQIIISGPRIEQICEVGEHIFGLESAEHTTRISPVLNLTYSIKKEAKDRYVFKQYCALKKSPLFLEIQNSVLIKEYGKKLYSDEFMKYLSRFVDRIGGSQNIIFAPTAQTARKIAIAMSETNETVEDVKMENLISYYNSTVSSNYSLCKTLKKGIAYHHGKLPHHVRRTLEKAISQKLIKDVVCTTTLLQGVNLPAQNIFIRNPHLYVKRTKSSAELTNYELANLRGRAGRLLKDYIGRAFVLDESEFADTEGYESGTLFEDVTKVLPTGYTQQFEEYKSPIENVLDENIAVNQAMQKYGYIISYIRQSILRYGDEAKKRMNDVGIVLSQKQIAAIAHKLNTLSVPKNICKRNRYWDPVVLDTIYKTYNGDIPNTPIERGAKAKLDKMLKFLRDSDVTSAMYEKYIPLKYRKGINRGEMISLGLRWAKGDPLHEILNTDRYVGEAGEEKIDETIELLQQTISYKVPLLLKPIFDMKKTDSCLLNCFQVGAFKILPRCMIELGIPRETALYLFDKIFDGEDIRGRDKVGVERFIREKIKDSYTALPYWIQVQTDYLR